MADETQRDAFPLLLETTEDAASAGFSARWRLALSGLLILHGLAHALPGMRAADYASGWPVGQPASVLVLPATALWLTGMTGFVAAGLGALGAQPFDRIWRSLAAVGGASSLLLLAVFRPDYGLPGAVISLLLLAGLWRAGAVHEPAPSPRIHGRRWHRLGDVAAVVFIAYLVVSIEARPWHMRWGSTDEELRMALPGDELAAEPLRYGIQHAVTIDAPAHAVWPWLLQIGQDRAGFYSYDWLERLFGARIHNVDRIVPEWQQLAAGDTVFATQPGYLGLRVRPGWRVARVDPGRAVVLENWGAFVLLPTDEGTTRLIVRTRGGGDTAPADLLLAPAGLLLFEVPHFIMQRRMLRGIQALAEGRHGS
jgi:hypothetical protein